MSIGAKIRQLRQRLGLNGDQFGDLCGVGRASVSHWESDTNYPSVESLLRLRQHEHFSFDWLLGGEQEANVLIARSPRAEYFVEKLELDKPRSEKTSQIEELVDISANLNERGLWELIGVARYLARAHPNQAARAAQ